MPVKVASDSDFSSTIANSEFVIVKFYADWCGSCKLLAPKYRRMSDDLRFSDVVFLDVNSETSPETRTGLNVDNLPFFATFHNGTVVESGATAKEDSVLGMLERLVS